MTFMLRVRNGTAYASGIVETGFWLGVTMGRLVLGFVTGRIGEKLAIVIYLVVSMGLELLFWLVSEGSCLVISLFSCFVCFEEMWLVETGLLLDTTQLYSSSVYDIGANFTRSRALWPAP